jgi:hypothetical protein
MTPWAPWHVAHIWHAPGCTCPRNSEWLCGPDELEWLLPGPVTTALAGQLLRPAKAGQAAPLQDLLAKFIDCQWPLKFLPAS